VAWELVGRDVIYDWLARERDEAVRLQVLEWLARFEDGPEFARGIADPGRRGLFVADVPGTRVTVVFYVASELEPPAVAIRSIL
jgi:hypothetical protein